MPPQAESPANAIVSALVTTAFNSVPMGSQGILHCLSRRCAPGHPMVEVVTSDCRSARPDSRSATVAVSRDPSVNKPQSKYRIGLRSPRELGLDENSRTPTENLTNSTLLLSDAHHRRERRQLSSRVFLEPSRGPGVGSDPAPWRRPASLLSAHDRTPPRSRPQHRPERRL